MPSFQIEVPFDRDAPKEQWNTVRDEIADVFRVCEAAEITLHRAPDGPVMMEVRVRDERDAVLVRIVLTTPPWRYDPYL